jgi:hypothetical protein
LANSSQGNVDWTATMTLIGGRELLNKRYIGHQSVQLGGA